jgi:ubiquinone/menaquinone biosynthesis C-methylase UbiE
MVGKMEIKRQPFQGVFNIIRFNWHFFAIVGFLLVALYFLIPLLPPSIQPYGKALYTVVALVMALSLLISHYVYDLSKLYQLDWIGDVKNKRVLTINAGFDETSEIILNKFPTCNLTIADFYNPNKHTEISIKRARLAYPPHESTLPISTEELPFPDDYFDCVLAILSVHEIRKEEERIALFTELRRVTTAPGEILVTEHLRDVPNFIAYTLGFFHFHSKSTWLATFKKAKLTLKGQINTTPFITTFKLCKHGSTF